MVRVQKDRGLAVAGGARGEDGRLPLLVGAGNRGAEDAYLVEDSGARRQRGHGFRAALQLGLIERGPGHPRNAHEVAEVRQR